MATNTTAVSGVAERRKSRSVIMHELRATFARWQERARIRFELQQMTTRELADLGLMPSDISDVANGTYRRGE